MLSSTCHTVGVTCNFSDSTFLNGQGVSRAKGRERCYSGVVDLERMMVVLSRCFTMIVDEVHVEVCVCVVCWETKPLGPSILQLSSSVERVLGELSRGPVRSLVSDAASCSALVLELGWVCRVRYFVPCLAQESFLDPPNSLTDPQLASHLLTQARPGLARYSFPPLPLVSCLSPISSFPSSSFLSN